MRCPAALALPALLVLLAACERDPAPAPAQRPSPSGASALAPAPAAAPEERPHPMDAAGRDWGEPDTAKVRKLFETRSDEVRRCYEAELQRHPDARGKLTLRFTIAESGVLRSVSVARTTFERRGVPACVEQVVRRWSTPFRPAEPVAVEYPFSFSPR